MQHCTGLYDRMKNIKTPEDIDNWIAERKRKYPTKSNIEMKKAETLEKKERGEIIERGKSKVQSSQQTRKPVRERKRRGKKRRIFEFKADPVEDGESQCCNGIQPFRGTYSLVEVEEDVAPVESVDNSPSGIQFSDDEDDAIPPNNSNIELNPVFSLVADYGSDSDDLPEELPIKKMKLEDPEKIESLPVPVMTPAKAKNSRKESSKMNPRKPTDEPSNSMGKPHPKRLMLLERLLSRSIQHERNYICQCIKYIADNNFFE